MTPWGERAGLAAPEALFLAANLGYFVAGRAIDAPRNAALRRDRAGLVAAGNASGIVDGGAAVVVAHEQYAKEKGWKPLGRIVSWAAAGLAPEMMGPWPIPAPGRVLARGGSYPVELHPYEVYGGIGGGGRGLVNVL